MVTNSMCKKENLNSKNKQTREGRVCGTAEYTEACCFTTSFILQGIITSVFFNITWFLLLLSVPSFMFQGSSPAPKLIVITLYFCRALMATPVDGHKNVCKINQFWF